MSIKTPRAARPRKRKALVEEQSLFWYRLAVTLVGWVVRFWIRRYRVLGVENVPATGGVFVIANHTTGMDPFLLGYAVRHRMPRGPGKMLIFQNPAVSFVLRRIGIFPLRQDIADASAVRAMVQLYRAGQVVLVFPEGTRSTTAEMNPFIPEFARLMIKLGATIVPAGIAGGTALMPIGRLFPHPNRAVVVGFGERFDLGAYRNRELTPELLAEASAAMQSRVKEALEQSYAYQQRL